MSFMFGTLVFEEAFPTSCSMQRVFTTMSGLSIESLEIPGMERRRFLQTNRPRTRLEFDTILHAESVAQVEAYKQLLLTHLDPSRGPQRLTVDDEPGWFWEATVVEEQAWQKLTWKACNGGFRYQAPLVFETFGDSAAREITQAPVAVPASTPTPLPTLGNTRSWPRIEVRGTLSAAQSVTIQVGQGGAIHSVVVSGPLTASQVMVLDYDTMDFAIWNSAMTTKIASVVSRMSNHKRLESKPLVPATIGSTHNLTVYPNSRRQ